MDNMEEKPFGIIECPHCHVKVLPTADNICPACRENMSDLQGVNPNQVALTIHESEKLPSFCFSCNRYTERTVRVSGDDDSDLPLLFRRSEENTSNVILYLPQCENCSESGEPEPLDVDYEYQKMTIVVHRGFRDRVFEQRENQSHK